MIDFWRALFSAHRPVPKTAVRLRVVKKCGRPLLLLPDDPSLAAAATALYPAQKTAPRIAKAILRRALAWRVPLPLECVVFDVALDEAFPRFVASLAGCAPGTFPPIAVLAGNPNTEGQRFIVLIFGRDRTPCAVVKAGFTAKARELIDAEQRFLAALPPGVAGAPAVRDAFQSAEISALAMDFFEGESVRGEDVEKIGALLGSWLDTQRTVLLSDLASWRRLAQTCASHWLWPALEKRLAGRSVHPAIFHGDFVPWNIKVSRGTWIVLDWERGELAGVPSWDWLHYVIQTAVLVRGRTGARLADEVETLIRSNPFAAYVSQAGVAGVERELALAWLLYVTEILKPSEGAEPLRDLLDLLARWWQFHPPAGKT
jgi:phosphotransferase family enzyme